MGALLRVCPSALKAMTSTQLHYSVFIVRVWQEQTADAPAAVWRFTLTASSSGIRHGFTTPEELRDALYLELKDVIESNDKDRNMLWSDNSTPE